MRHDPVRSLSFSLPAAGRQAWRAVTRRRKPRPDAPPAPRRAQLDRALRDMLRDCPVPDSLIDFIEQLEDETPDAPDEADDKA
jgi:hypothetical protein